MPSPVEDRPGLLLRDSLRYSDAILIIPPELIACLAFYDGEKTDGELHEMMYRASGDLRAGEVGDQITAALAKAGFLEDENFERLREARHREFAESEFRRPAHAGSGYPDESGELSETMRHWMSGDAVLEDGPIVGIAAPHVSPEGGFESYRAAYARLGPELRDKTFVVLGTSHYGMPDRFGLTRKPWVTPFGEARTDRGLVDELANAAPDAIGMEDYCHSVEHSIEFQVVFLQSVFGPDIQVAPILCGSFFRSLYQGGMPEDDETAVSQYAGEYCRTAIRRIVLGAGRRYGAHGGALR
jgi:hypothetical protein